MILLNFTLPPDKRTHLIHVLCYGIILSPKAVKDLDSFLYPFCQDSQISKPETPYFPKPPHPYLSLFFAILRDFSQFFAIPCYKAHEPHEPSRLTLFNHFVLLMSLLFSLSSLSDVCRDNETEDDDIGD